MQIYILMGMKLHFVQILQWTCTATEHVVKEQWNVYKTNRWNMGAFVYTYQISGVLFLHVDFCVGI